MSRTTEQRPPQVTLAATIIMAGSVMVLVSAWDRIAGLRSLESRDAVEAFLAEPPGSELGLDLEGALSLLHGLSVVTGVAACATGILGWFVLQGDTTIRRALSVAAVPLFLTGLIVGGFSSSFVAAATVMLWMPPAREWFATGRWTPPPPREELQREAREREAELQQKQQEAERALFAPPPGASPPPPAAPEEGRVGQPEHDAGRPGPAATPYATTPEPQVLAPHDQRTPRHSAPMASHRPGKRPGAVVTAFVITMASTFLVAMVSGLAIVLVATAPDLLMDEVGRQRGDAADLTLAQVRTSTYATGGVCLLMSVAAMVFAGLGMMRRPWARVAWLVMAAASAGACLFVVLASPALASGVLALLPAVAAVTTVVFLRREDVRRWFAGAPRG